jgi:hypothetical protein
MIPIARPKFIIPTAEPEFTNPCACRIPPLPALSPLVKGGEGWGERGFEACAFVDFGSAVGISTASKSISTFVIGSALRLPSNRAGNPTPTPKPSKR